MNTLYRGGFFCYKYCIIAFYYVSSRSKINFYFSSEDILTQELTEEDRNLAAALVAVQLSQQQKQQQLQDAALPPLIGRYHFRCQKPDLFRTIFLISWKQDP